jgi:hypothetical protein
MALSERIGSPRFVRRVTMVAALVLIAGIVAFTIAFFGNTAEDESTPVQPAAGQAAAQPSAAGAEENQRAVPLDTKAREVAGRFILSAVTREDMAEAWKITDPDSDIRRCGEAPCTYKEWLTGNVPIQPYPAEELDDATFAIHESVAGFAVLQVALLPKDGSAMKGQIFYVGLRKVGTGSKAKWLVTYWAPHAINPVPDTGDTH